MTEADSPRTLTPRWSQLDLIPAQLKYAKSQLRYNVVPAGRRSGKTEIAKRKIVRLAMQAAEWDDAWFIAGAPTHAQAKRIFWRDLCKLVPKWAMMGPPQESALTIKLITGTEITVMGMDKAERVEGRPINGGVLDEYGNMKEEVWSEHISPACAERQAWFDFIGVPEGRNHYFDLFEYARDGEDDEWAAHTWTTEDVLPQYLGAGIALKEIMAAKRRMDLITYKQEFLASFENWSGMAYYAFEKERHAVEARDYDPKLPLITCWDFNISPGTMAVIQEANDVTWVIDEVHIESNSNTNLVAEKFLTKYRTHPGDVYLYGDATGGAPGSAQIEGSDWELIKKKLKPVFQRRLKNRVARGNPRERVRLNAVNSRLYNAAGQVHLKVDPRNAPNVVKDFEGTPLKDDGSGEIDKKKAPKLSHLTDGIGYYIHLKYPLFKHTVASRTAA